MRLNRTLLCLAVLPLALSACGVFDAFSACRADYQRPDFARLQQQLDSAQTRWKAASLQNYSYEFSQLAAPVGFPTVRITVRQGVVSSTETLNPRPADPAPNPGRTIDERFSDIASSIVSASTGECAELAAAYDASDGRPISLSSGTALKNLADGNGFWTISNFTRL